MRDKIMKPIGRRSGHFVWRNHDILRIEAFSDAVFAITLTLTIVSTEVPVTFNELFITLKGMLGFAICFAFLFLVWYKQYLFFRYFGLRDLTTILLNAVLIFVVLFYVYPLKFLFTLLTSGNEVMVNGEMVNRLNNALEVQQLMIFYSSGFLAIYVMLFLLYNHAWNKRHELMLSDIELFNLKTQLWNNALTGTVGLLAIIVAVFIEPMQAEMAGFCFMLIGPVSSVLFGIRIKKLKQKFSEEQMHHHTSLVTKSKTVLKHAGE